MEQLARELCQAGARILITAPSNAAVDNICRRLLDLPLLRHGSNRDVVQPEIAAACWHGDDDVLKAYAAASAARPGEIHASTHIGLLRSPYLAAQIEGRPPDVILDGLAWPVLENAAVPLPEPPGRVFGDPQQLRLPLAPEAGGPVEGSVFE